MRYLVLLLLLISSKSFAQTSSLHITLRANEPGTDTFHLVVRIQNDTILKEIYQYGHFHGPEPMSVYIQKDNLPASDSCLAELRNDDGKVLISEPFVLRADRQTDLHLSYFVSDYVGSEAPLASDMHTTMETFVSLWQADTNRMAPSAFSIGGAFGGWEVLSKHVGFVWDMGIGCKVGKLNEDTTFAVSAPPGKKNEYYSYFDLHDRFRLRFSTGNQHIVHKSGLLFDLGVGYHFPLYFRHVVRYPDKTKLTQRGLHHFSDLRVSAGIGNHVISAFLEYRLFNHIVAPMPEMPPFMIGLRINFPNTFVD